ncbi:hypothetical protein A2803_03030 [Candidatus Woesebacteria bacterium RIFCSPHIGHO2_01_FULL_44_21]|uniref:Type II secretion system protein GspG C-terminal domain-containing protein n=1 Tax=Candidatus Woesebacteria bacterium RIFCSPHIGHO2_01_FULL_44_21 TaxID=1802503 RepID=A0A1F7Z0C1_9BACT|nr:MAG: hypothetical protein A2803_03030 [Candidatus Woesebacteria bacterium RIFCSPHIGHO2_01_FULL_44_21]OGM69211.1 MAG: hypothetical protein A2897_04350 [Candidatus Woesebacteria bacterium RIFCSPLOWO2_01_FULL_44_24b]
MKNKQVCFMRNKGFTLIELLIVVAILGLLSTFAIIRFTGSQGSARDARRQSDLRQYQTALEVYANRSNSLYPVQASVVNIATTMCGTLNLSSCPTDPSASASMFYRYQSNAGGSDYILWATLERPDASGATQYFILCSNGNVGKSTTAPSSVVCPI